MSWPWRVEGGDVVDHILIENDQTGGIALLGGEIGERCGDIAGVIELADFARAVGHGRAGIEQDQELGVGFAFEAFEVDAVGAGEDVPVDVAEIVAFDVLAVFGELLAEAEGGGTVQAGDEAIHNGLRDEVEGRDGGEDGGIEESLQHR